MATSLHSGKAKINYLTLRVDEMRDGESWCKYALRPALFVSGHQGKPGKPPSSGLRLAQIIIALSGACGTTLNAPSPG